MVNLNLQFLSILQINPGAPNAGLNRRLNPGSYQLTTLSPNPKSYTEINTIMTKQYIRAHTKKLL